MRRMHDIDESTVEERVNAKGRESDFY